MSEVGQRIRQYREALGLTTSEVARRAKLPQKTLWRIENGVTGDPGVYRLLAVARVFGVPLGLLVEADEVEFKAALEGALKQRFGLSVAASTRRG